MELLTIEFRYHDKPSSEHDSGYRSKTITIGVFDTINEAVEAGNKIITDVLSKKFQIRDEKFSVKGVWGIPKRLITSRKKGVQFFAKIENLDFSDITTVMNDIFKANIHHKL